MKVLYPQVSNSLYTITCVNEAVCKFDVAVYTKVFRANRERRVEQHKHVDQLHLAEAWVQKRILSGSLRRGSLKDCQTSALDRSEALPAPERSKRDIAEPFHSISNNMGHLCKINMIETNSRFCKQTFENDEVMFTRKGKNFLAAFKRCRHASGVTTVLYLQIESGTQVMCNRTHWYSVKNAWLGFSSRPAF